MCSLLVELKILCRCSLENVTIKDRELTVDKEDNGITNKVKVSKSDKVKHCILKYIHSA